MPDITKLSYYPTIVLKDTNGKPITIDEVSSASQTTFSFSAPLTNSLGSVLTGNFWGSLRATDGSGKQENVFIKTGKISADGTSATEVVRGIDKDGIVVDGSGIPHGSAANTIDYFPSGTLFEIVLHPFNIESIYKAIQGGIATGANLIRVGDGTDSDIYYYFQNADANKPGLRYNKTDNHVEWSDDGTSWTYLGTASGHGTTAEIKSHADVDAAVSDSPALGDVLHYDGSKWNKKSLFDSAVRIGAEKLENQNGGGRLATHFGYSLNVKNNTFWQKVNMSTHNFLYNYAEIYGNNATNGKYWIGLTPPVGQNYVIGNDITADLMIKNEGFYYADTYRYGFTDSNADSAILDYNSNAGDFVGISVLSTNNNPLLWTAYATTSVNGVGITNTDITSFFDSTYETTTFNNVRIEYTTTSVLFYINGVLAATHTTNIPSFQMYWGYGYNNREGATQLTAFYSSDVNIVVKN